MMSPEELAADLLLSYGRRRFITNPVAIADDYGIHVFTSTFKRKDIRVAVSRKRPPSIYVHRDSSRNEQRYAIAHALGHYLLHREAEAFICTRDLFQKNGLGLIDSNGVVLERAANQFAMALLLPDLAFLRAWKVADSIHEMARDFGVPAYIVMRRARELEITV